MFACFPQYSGLGKLPNYVDEYVHEDVHEYVHKYVHEYVPKCVRPRDTNFVFDEMQGRLSVDLYICAVVSMCVVRRGCLSELLLDPFPLDVRVFFLPSKSTPQNNFCSAVQPIPSVSFFTDQRFGDALYSPQSDGKEIMRYGYFYWSV